jgi:hypothetical protein
VLFHCYVLEDFLQKINLYGKKLGVLIKKIIIFSTNSTTQCTDHVSQNCQGINSATLP